MILSLLSLLGAAASLRVCGSETLGRAAAAWSDGWSAQSPAVAVETHFPGSGSSLAALGDGTCRVALLSRPPDPAALARLRTPAGRAVQLRQVGWDEVVFFVHRSNPVRSMSTAALRTVLERPDPRWHPYGRNALSGTRGWVLQSLVPGGTFAPTTRELPGPHGVVRAVAGDPRGIGYSGKEAVHGEVAVLSLTDPAGRPVRLLRPLFLAAPAGDALAGSFLAYALSSEGQERLGNCGLSPLAAAPR